MTRNYHSRKKPASTKLFNNKLWQQCLDSFLHSHNADGATTTAALYRSTLAEFFSDPEKTPDQYTRQDVETFIHAETHGHRASGTTPMAETKNARKGRIASFYAYASQYAVLRYKKLVPLFNGMNPCVGIKNATVTEQDRTMEVEHVRAFFGAIPRDTVQGLRDFALFSCYLWCGRRRAEIVRLCWGDLRKERLSSGHEGWTYQYQGKGHRSKDRRMEMPPPAMAAILAYLEANSRLDSIQPEDAIFHSPKTGRNSLSPKQVNALFRRYARLAALPKHLSVHSFRYTAAYDRWCNNGENLVKTQDFLGHSDPKDTLRYIVHWKAQQADTEVPAIQRRYGAL